MPSGIAMLFAIDEALGSTHSGSASRSTLGEGWALARADLTHDLIRLICRVPTRDSESREEQD